MISTLPRSIPKVDQASGINKPSRNLEVQICVHTDQIFGFCLPQLMASLGAFNNPGGLD